MSASQGIPLEGRLSAWEGGLIRPIGGDLPDLLVSISRRAQTGTLILDCADGEKRLFVNEGQIIFAESSSSDDRLGEYLLRIGMLRLSDYLSLSSQVGKGKRLGALLVENGFLNVDQLVPAVIGQVRRIVVRLFRQGEFRYRFVEQPLRKEAITLKMRLAELILEGVQQVDSWPRLFRGMGSLDRQVCVRAEAVNEFTGLKLSSEVLQVLALLENPTQVALVGSKTKLSDFRCAQILWAFRSLGWIEERVVQPSRVVASRAPSEVPIPAAPAEAPLPLVEVAVQTVPVTSVAPVAPSVATPNPAAPPAATAQPNPNPKDKPKPSDTLSRLGDFDFEISDLDLEEV